MKSTGTMKEGTVLVLSMLSFCFMPDDEFPVHVVSGVGGAQHYGCETPEGGHGESKEGLPKPAFLGTNVIFFNFVS